MSQLLIHNPLKESFPSDPIDRIARLARDLAWGSINHLWQARVEIRHNKITATRGAYGGMLAEYLDSWSDQLPAANLLVAFGYLKEQSTQNASGVNIVVGDLTQEAFTLLKQPPRMPEVYISYHRQHSSAVALLAMARMKLAGIASPFLDMNLNPGDALHNEQEERVRMSQYFVCIIAQGSLHSPYMKRELEWALSQSTVNIILLWHGGFVPSYDYPPELTARNAIRVTEESAEAYHIAMMRLLNRLGYVP